MRALGLETELALGFVGEDPHAEGPTQLQIYEALRAALLAEGYRACDALYYKGGSFLQDGSLLHFEVSQLEDPQQGLLEWATPECAGPREAVAYVAAQEQALVAALPRATDTLAEAGFVGRILLLKNTEDRAGNAYGAHESYAAQERPLDARRALFVYLLHPLVLLVLALGLLAFAVPLLLMFSACLFVYAVVALPAEVPGLGAPFVLLERAMERAGTYLVEPGPGPGQGVVARGFVLLARAGGALFSLTASRAILGGHLPALAPFLATRPLLSGSGHLDARGRYRLSPRGAITTRVAAAFVIGAWRPMFDLKEFFFRSPWRYLRGRKRLHVVVGDANRSQRALWLRLATTHAVLDALEAGALDALVASLVLPEGALGVFRRVCADLSLQAPVAFDRTTGEALSGLQLQRRYLEATWQHQRALGEPEPERREALLAWDAALRALSARAPQLVETCDWARKLERLEGQLVRSLPGLSRDEAWGRLAAWGGANAVVEEHCPAWEPPAQANLDRVALGARLGRRGARRFLAAARGLDLAEWPRVRAAWCTLKAADLGYHQLVAQSGEGFLSEGEVARARREPPAHTRAALRGWALGLLRPESETAGTLRLGWDRIEVTPKVGAAVLIGLPHVERSELSAEDQARVRAVLEA